MSVKTIFKTLIGTIVIIVILSLCTELFNVNVAGMEIKSACNMACKQSAELFTQETYRVSTDTSSGSTKVSQSVNMKDVKTNGGNIFISGNFYGDDETTEGIWENIYGDSSDTAFEKVCTMTEGQHVITDIDWLDDGEESAHTVYELKYISSTIKDKYADGSSKFPWTSLSTTSGVVSIPSRCPITIFPELGKLYAGIYGGNEVSSAADEEVTYDDFKNNNPIVQQKSFAIGAQKMREQYYTPVNIGFPYFDPDTVNKIFQWNLAMILSNDSSNSIQRLNDTEAEAEEYYVNYKGFRCYPQYAYINKLKYYIVDTQSDASKLRELTNMDAASLRKIGEENDYVTVVGIEYTIPIEYQGITPLKKIFEYVWDNEVDGTGAKVNGLDGQGGSTDNGTDRSGMTGTGEYNARLEDKQTSDTGAGYVRGGMTNDTDEHVNGILSTTGEINYVLVR